MTIHFLSNFLFSVILFTFGVITNLGAACTDRWYQVPFWEKAYYSNVHFFMFLLRSKYLSSFHQSFHIKKTFPLKTRESRWICWIWNGTGTVFQFPLSKTTFGASQQSLLPTRCGNLPCIEVQLSLRSNSSKFWRHSSPTKGLDNHSRLKSGKSRPRKFSTVLPFDLWKVGLRHCRSIC